MNTSNTTQPIRYSLHPHTLGSVLIASDDTGLCFIGFDSETNPADTALADLQRRFPRAALEAVSINQTPDHAAAISYIEALSSGKALPTMPNTNPSRCGTPFQHQVWQALQTIPRGHTVTYTELATRMGYDTPNRMARAVGGAVGANPLAILIPCHRVVQASGALGGYRWGVERKAALLKAEGV